MFWARENKNIIDIPLFSCVCVFVCVIRMLRIAPTLHIRLFIFFFCENMWIVNKLERSLRVCVWLFYFFLLSYSAFLLSPFHVFMKVFLLNDLRILIFLSSTSFHSSLFPIRAHFHVLLQIINIQYYHCHHNQLSSSSLSLPFVIRSVSAAFFPAPSLNHSLPEFIFFSQQSWTIFYLCDIIFFWAFFLHSAFQWFSIFFFFFFHFWIPFFILFFSLLRVFYYAVHFHWIDVWMYYYIHVYYVHVV